MSKSCKLCMWFHHPRWSRTRVFLGKALKFRFIIDDYSRKSQAETFQEWWSSIKYILLYCTCTFFKIKSCFHWENVVFLRDFRTGVATCCCHWALWKWIDTGVIIISSVDCNKLPWKALLASNSTHCRFLSFLILVHL